MSFQEIAQPLIDCGIPVFPIAPGTKEPARGLKFLQEATCDPIRVAQWDAEDPNYSVALLARSGEFCFLEFDVSNGLTVMCKEMGQEMSRLTRAQKSPGHNGTQLIFRHTERSGLIGNRSVNLPEACTDPSCVKAGRLHHHEWFSFRAHNKYLLGAGSIHPNGLFYGNAWDIEPEPVPGWVLDFVENHSKPEITVKPKQMPEVSDEFDFDHFCDYFGINILGNKDDVWEIVEECPGVGRQHEGSKLTGFYWDGSHLGWSCFAQECPAHGIGIGGLIKMLNDKKIEEGGVPYRGPIWSNHEEDDISVWEEVTIDDPEPEPVIETKQITLGDDGYAAVVTMIEEDVKANAPLPSPRDVAVEDPHGHTGLDFPDDGCCMYGKLGEMAQRFPRLQLGWLYPAMLGSASALDIRDEDGYLHSNLYVALIGEIADGKTACWDAAIRSIYHGEGVVLKENPGGHRGLVNCLSDTEPLPFLLALDELRMLLNSTAYERSNLPSMLCALWSDTECGASDKKGNQKAFGKLSILGGMAVKDQSEFAEVFGAGTIKGLSDRFLFGYSSKYIKYRPTPVRVEVIDPKPVKVPDWVWDVKDDWVGEQKDRRRMSEQALRVALITAAVNQDKEITKDCLEAAFRFCEWQMRLRMIYRPGLAKDRSSEAFEAVYFALIEQRDKQQASGVGPVIKKYNIRVEEAERWKLLAFSTIVNSKSYYRKYSGLIDRTRETMVKNGIIQEVHERDEDQHGNEKQGRKTPFVLLLQRVK